MEDFDFKFGHENRDDKKILINLDYPDFKKNNEKDKLYFWSE